MMRTAPIASGLLLLAAGALGGCDRFYSIGTASRPLAAMPDPACVTATLQQTPGVTSVDYGPAPVGGFEVLPHWGKETGTNHLWTYHAGAQFAWVQIIDGRWNKRYSNYLMSRHRIPEETRVVIEPLAFAIDERLERACGIPPAPAGKR